MKTFRLSSGATITHISAHGFLCSDGTEIGPQDKPVVEAFTLERKFSNKGTIKGMALNEMCMSLSNIQIEKLKEISAKVDIVVVPFPVLSSLREQGIRAQFTNVVAYNATKETQRSVPQDKVIDINNWSY